MFMLHELLTPGRDNVSELRKVPEALYKKVKGATPGHQYCRWAMQLTFAAGQCIGRLTDDEEYKEQNPNSAPPRGGMQKNEEQKIPTAPPREQS